VGAGRFGSVADNIRYGRPEASEAAIVRAAELAAADNSSAPPDGYDPDRRARDPVGRAAPAPRRARAVLKDAPILLLDEATSALDAESERLVQAALDRLMQGRTTLVIAHRLATVLSADRILVMDQGGIVEAGTHASLAARNGLYARLARLQFAEGDNAFAAANADPQGALAEPAAAVGQGARR
jgi:ATP-binding cassette subfamily B protein